MKEVVADGALVACCGLYCGGCGRYRVGKCPGCLENVKASWCRVRACCLSTGRSSCADCSEFRDVRECKVFFNPIARIIGFVFRSNRSACIGYIRQRGREAFAEEMASRKRHSLPR